MKLRHGPGRPMKYGRASRALTLTLPEDVIERLASLDSDLGRAIVALVERHATTRVRRVRRAEIAPFGNHAVIVVNPAKELRRLSGVQLVPIGNGRALVSLEPPYSVPQFELDLRDAIARGETVAERQTLAALADILQESRRSRRVRLEERTIIVLESKRNRRKTRRRLNPRTQGPHRP
jgi:hypothetical protein